MIHWTIDPTHSVVEFKVKHLMITNVKGHFEDYDLDVTTETDEFKVPKIKFIARTASIDTGDQKRDEHLKSVDFFDSATYPELTFEGTKYEPLDDDNFKLYGNLTIKGITKEVMFDVEYEGMMKDPWGNTKVGFVVSGKINRKDWGLNWNAALEAGGMLVSDEVKINCEIQLMKAAQREAA